MNSHKEASCSTSPVEQVNPVIHGPMNGPGDASPAKQAGTAPGSGAGSPIAVLAGAQVNPTQHEPVAGGPVLLAPTPGPVKSALPRRLTPQELIDEADKWLRIIESPDPGPELRRWITGETVDNFRFYYNRSYVEHKKATSAEIVRTQIEWTGLGSLLRDIDGNELIDCLGGYGMYSAGMRHPRIVAAVRAQLERMPLSSQELLDPLRGALARLLGELAPGDLQYSFFINNGTDAVEGALKLARLYTGRVGFISSIGAFHGKSMGALSVMGKSKFRKMFEPLLPETYFVPYGDAESVEQELWKSRVVGREIAAIIMEPVQGENGAVVPPDDFWPRLRELCDEYGCLLIADEVQTGMGRTGKLFGVEHWNVAPDIMCLGKALGGGVMPLSAFMASPRIWQKLNDDPFVQTSTFGGNPLACAAGIAAIQVTLQEKLPEQAARKGHWLMSQLQTISSEFPQFVQMVRGKGLLICMVFHSGELGWEFCTSLYDQGVLVAGTLTNAQTVRFEPALNIPDGMLEQVCVAVRLSLERMRAKQPGLQAPSRISEPAVSRRSKRSSRRPSLVEED